ncbi:hypothetical protein [Novosphingobium lentum]|uniref:hypothetical protein n=1 Tax=Novosphingobium lentum TaxID=145287 RepID=UPI0008344B23|nr:hypothetical protein [Novosphingobium lentum]
MARFANPLKRERTASPGGFMASSAELARPPIPVHYVTLSPRERRAQAVHRLQVGLFGLAGMLLLVSLANIIMDRAQLAERATISLTGAGATPGAAASSAANDPLVDMGVVPELPVGKAGAGAAGAPGGGAVTGARPPSAPAVAAPAAPTRR